MKKVPTYIHNSQETVTGEFLLNAWNLSALRNKNFSCSLNDMNEIIMTLRDLGCLEFEEEDPS